jgi:hypothetical protein
VATSIGLAVTTSLAIDAVVILGSRAAPLAMAANIALFNGGAILQACTGAVIEWRRPGHRVGRLLMVTGPVYAGLAALWSTVGELATAMGPQLEGIVGVTGGVLSYAGVALMIAGLPLIFPTGTLPSPRWRMAVGALTGLFAVGLTAMATRPGTPFGSTTVNPFGLPGWPTVLQPLVDLIPIELLALVLLGLISQIVRYRGGDQVIRHQVRWFAVAVTVILVGFIGVIVEMAVRTDGGPLLSGIVAYAGILLMPVAVGVAVLRYRLYDIDRLISRGLAWGLLTAILVGVYAAAVLVLQGALAGVTQGQTLAVAASTLLAAALFQPLRRSLQHLLDHRFDRSHYDAERTVGAFSARLRDQVDLKNVRVEIASAIEASLRPGSTAIWVREIRRP